MRCPQFLVRTDKSGLSIYVAVTSRMDVRRTIMSTGLHRCTGNRMAILPDGYSRFVALSNRKRMRAS